MAERKVLTTCVGGGTLEVEPGAVWFCNLQGTLGPVTCKLEGDVLRWMLQACLEALGESGVVLTRKGGDRG